MSWTEERIATLTKMWETGATASQIAEELGEVSRNAVIGKAHRLGLKARPSPVRANEKKPVQETAKSEPAAAPASAPPPAPPVAEDAPAKSEAQSPSDPTPEEPVVEAKETPRVVSVGPGGFLRQGPGDQQPPIPPAPPRRLVPAKPSSDIAGKTGLLDLSDRVCRWPMGHPGEPDFHFCGGKVNPGFPYCVDHCGRAYQAQLPRGARRPPPPLLFGGPRVR